MTERSFEQLKLVECNYEVLIAQIAIYTGKRSDGLTALQDWYNQIEYVSFTECQECKLIIETQGHKTDCNIVKDYLDIFNK